MAQTKYGESAMSATTIEGKTSPLSQQQVHWRSYYGPWAIVTGASDGIGREMARHLAMSAMNLVLVARRSSVLEQLSQELSAQYGIQTQIISADLSQSAAVDAVIEATNDLDIGLLVACAGFGTSGPFINANLEQELNMLDLNCRAVLAMSHHFGQRFARRGRGGIILMSSLLAFQGVPLSANYAATKAYIQSLAEALYVELAPLGVHVLASAPGPIHSGFAARANMRMSLALEPESVAQATLNALGRRGTVRPGWLSIALESALAILPRWVRARIMGRIMEGMASQSAQGVL